MIDIPNIISGSTIPSQDTWNEYIKVTANMTEKAIKLRCKKQHHQKMIKHFALKVMREMIGSKDDLSEEMIENMGTEEMLRNLEGDYKIETLQIKRASTRKRDAARYAAMSEVEKASYLENKRKKAAARYAEEKEKTKCTEAKEACRKYGGGKREHQCTEAKEACRKEGCSGAGL